MGRDEVQNNRESLIRSYGTIQTLSPSDRLFLMDDPASEISFILDGQISAHVFSETGQQTWVSQYLPGDFIGYIDYFIENTRTSEAVADTFVQIVVLKPQMFETLLSQNPDLQTLIQRDMAQRLNDMTLRLVEAVTLSAPGRVCAELKRMAKPIGRDPDSQIIRPNPVFVEVARRISSTRETVSRTVSRLCSLDVLSRTSGAIIIKDMERLERHIR